MNPKYKAILKRASVKPNKEHPDAPPAWAMTIALSLIRGMEGYGDVALIRDAAKVAKALDVQWRLGFKRGQEAGARSTVEFMAAVVEGQYK